MRLDKEKEYSNFGKKRNFLLKQEIKNKGPQLKLAAGNVVKKNKFVFVFLKEKMVVRVVKSFN